MQTIRAERLRAGDRFERVTGEWWSVVATEDYPDHPNRIIIHTTGGAFITERDQPYRTLNR